MTNRSRRRFLWLAGAAGLGALGLRLAGPRLLRPGAPRPIEGPALELTRRCLSGLRREEMWDTHAHLVGLGSGGTGCWIDPAMQSHLHPIRRLQFDAYRESVGLHRRETADADYLDRLLALHRLANPRGRLLLLAFDANVDQRGREIFEASALFTPNPYVLRLAREHPELEACVSIHPYRRDALERLDRALAAGARAVKWLPNAMGIDPASPACDGFYRRLAEAGVPLITHAGWEWAVAAGSQKLGNPLRLRRPLDAGVRVVVAHCASFGKAEDLDAPASERRELKAFEAFLRLMDERQYRHTLFADISALTQLNRSGRPLREMLKASEYHPRLVNGSDYPLPELGRLFGTAKLRWSGYLTAREHRLCNEIYDANPLLGDLVVKRCLKVAERGRVHRFPPRVFETAWLFRGERPG